MNILGSTMEFIRKAERGVTLQEICSNVRLERHTVAKYLESLRSKGLVNYKQIGMSKLWFAAKHPLIEVLKENDNIASGIKEIADSAGKVAIINKDFKIEWSNIDAKHSSCYETLGHSKEMCTNCPAHKTMQTGKASEVQMGRQLVITKPLKNDAGEIIGVVEVRKK